MFGSSKDPAVETDEPATFDQVKGFSTLPPKERILAASIYAGFRQALREERDIAGAAVQTQAGPLRASTADPDLAARIRSVHKQGSLHPMDRGEVCEADGQRWPCSTIRMVADL